MLIERTPLQSQIISFIYEYIKTHNLKAGDRLPPQGTMADMMGISKASIREAIKTLEAKEVVSVLNGKGVYIQRIEDSFFTSQIDLKKEKETLLDLLHVRKILDIEAVKLLIKNATNQELDELKEVTQSMMDKYYREVRQADEDREFHRLIYKHCHNVVLYQLYMTSVDLMTQFQDFPLGLSDPFTETIPLHCDLYFAIRERNTKKAISILNSINFMLYNDIADV